MRVLTLFNKTLQMSPMLVTLIKAFEDLPLSLWVLLNDDHRLLGKFASIPPHTYVPAMRIDVIR